MNRWLIILAALSLPVLCRAEEPSIEFCQASKSKLGETYYLGHSRFVVGEKPEKGHPMRIDSRKSQKPLTYEFKFPFPVREPLWLECSYKTGTASFVEYVAIENILVRCLEIFSEDPPARVVSFKCEKRYFKM